MGTSTIAVILLIFSGVILVVAIARSVRIERLCRQRDRAFDNYMKRVKAKDFASAKHFLDKYRDDPVFKKHAEAANAIQEWINKQKENDTGYPDCQDASYAS